jgi:raffinose/stachyose/melibiose transport system permease protein
MEISGREKALNYLVLTIFAVIVIGPLIGISVRAFNGDVLKYGNSGVDLIDRLGLQAFYRAWVQGRLASSLTTTATLAISITAAATVLSVLAGYAFGTLRFRGANALFTLTLLGIVLPVETLLIPLFYGLRAFGLIDTLVGLALPHIALFLPFGIFWMRAFFRSLPRSILEAARMDGAGTWDTLWRVLVPSGRPAILTLIVLFFTWSWNSYLLYLVLAPGQKIRPVALSLTRFLGERQTDEAAQAAVSVIISIPVILVFLFLQRHFIRGVLSGAVKG